MTQVVISPEVAGEIIELPVKEGQLVKKGDLLVQIKPDNYAAAKNSVRTDDGDDWYAPANTNDDDPPF